MLVRYKFVSTTNPSSQYSLRKHRKRKNAVSRRRTRAVTLTAFAYISLQCIIVNYAK